jgi:23S rRNA pseudouridine1911/1915/1917 synthase
MNRVTLVVEDESIRDVRADVYLAELIPSLGRSQLKQRIETFTVNGRDAKLSRRISHGDLLECSWNDPPEVSFGAEDIPLSILYEDESCLVVNKPRGMVVHPAAGNSTGTLVQAILFRCHEIGGYAEGETRPGIVHRLDKETSGVIIAAKNRETQEYLAAQFRARKVAKKYYALARGRIFPASGEIDANIARDPRNRQRFTVSESGGKPSKTRYRVIRRFGVYSFVSLMPLTGRTHQLRVHLQSLGAPILGDPVYARKDAAYPKAPLMLHAFSLSITLPGEDLPRTFRAPLPDDFRSVLAAITRAAD